MRLAKFVVAILFSLLVLPAQAGFTFKFTPAPPSDPDRPWNIVCFERQGLTAVLDTIVNEQQFHMNDPWQTITKQRFNKLGCAYVQIPLGSHARRAGSHRTRNDFVFPISMVRYSTTGQVMFTADAIFPSRDSRDRDRHHRR